MFDPIDGGLRGPRAHAILRTLETVLVIAIARAYARALLGRASTWGALVAASLLAVAGVSLDLFGFDGSPSRSAGTVVGSFEIVVALLAIGGRLSGIASPHPDSFRSIVVQSAGSTATDLGSTVGAAVGAGVAAWPALTILYVLYNLNTASGVGVLHLLLVGPALVAEGLVAAAWAGLGSRIAGRVGGAMTGIAAFVVARLELPAAVRAGLPGPLSSLTLPLIAATFAGALAAFGLVLVTQTLPAVGEEGP